MEGIEALNEALCYWLGYQVKIGRECLIHEASLRYPIADSLTANKININHLSLEKSHPYFLKKFIDICILSNGTDEINDIFELKLAKSTTGILFGDEHQRVIDDILRLAYFNKMTAKNAYFIICGTYTDFKNYFIGDIKDPIMNEAGKVIQPPSRREINDVWDTSGSNYNSYFDFYNINTDSYKEFEFTLPNEENLIEIQRIEGLSSEVITTENKKKLKELKFGLYNFQKNYTPKNGLEFDNSLRIKTKCVSLTEFTNKPNRTHACGIWKVETVN